MLQPDGLRAQTADQYSGICDASAGVAVSEDSFIVGNDETNLLPIYRRGTAAPIATLDLRAFLKSPEVRAREADIEGAATLAGATYWITSHGRNKDAEERPQRYRFFATTFDGNSRPPSASPIGDRAYAGLLEDLLSADRTWKLGLEAASKLAPKADGLNIEGLAATPDGQLLIGFRSPLVAGKTPGEKPRAIIVPLLNPKALVDQQAESHGGAPVRAAFGEPIAIRLQGQGIRSLERVGDHYLIIAGPARDNDEEDEGNSRLYTWSGLATDDPQVSDSIAFPDFNPEAIFAIGTRGEVLILSDDGTRTINGQDCKELDDANAKSFRTMTYQTGR
jgi:hypothetical protein